MKTLTKFLPCTIGCILVLPIAQADTQSVHEFSGNASITTDYLFRGVTQTNEGPAIQGGFDFTHVPSGFYLGTWASSVEFNSKNNTDDSSIEMDLYGGIGGEFSNGLSWDVGGIFYYYPDQNEDSGADYDCLEVYGGLGYTFAGSTLEPTVGIKFSYSDDYFGEDGDSLYSEGSLDLSLPKDFGLGFHMGFLDVDGGKTNTNGFSYAHTSMALSKKLAGFDFDLSYSRMFDSDDCPATDKGFCKAVVFSASRSF
uniref:Uncharacterized protein n=1 Tax=Candidatus Kentrum sp. FW TaxID=2126338 RepID=A0A450SM07_9GAMM|nr:MAG: conserved hypothetical protein [Candidatus Kentron sp. FW]